MRTSINNNGIFLAMLLTTFSAFNSYGANLREYWLAVESEKWNPVPHAFTVKGVSTTLPTPEATFNALRFHAYSADYKSRLPEDPILGIAGPVIEAEVGDHVVIHFRNLDSVYNRPHSLHVHGLQYDNSMDGAFSGDQPDKPGTAVKVGEDFTYVYDAVPTSLGVWPYHDHSVDGTDNTALGLFGAVRVHSPVENPFDREFYVFFTGLEPGITGLKRDFDTINGLAYMENTPMFMANQNEMVRFNVLSFGSEFHTFHIHGYRWLHDEVYQDVREIGPAETWSVQFKAENLGNWMLHCHRDDHADNGMMSMFMVQAAQKSNRK